MAKAPAKPRKTAPAAKRPAHLPRGRWLGDFPDLSGAELALVTACGRGEVWTPEGWDEENPVRPTEATPDNTIRGELVRFLALGGDTLHPVYEEGVMIGGGWISTMLNLHQACASVRLQLRYCHLAMTPNFMGAGFPELGLSGSSLPGLEGDRLIVKGSVFLRDGFLTTREVHLRGAQIGGDMDCSGGTFIGSGGRALTADRIEVKGSIFLRDGFTANGKIRLVGAQIGGSLSCANSSFSDPNGEALVADRIDVKGGVFFGDRFKADGEVRLLGGQIGGGLYCSGGSFANPTGLTLSADGVNLIDGLFLRDARFDGAIDLTKARIGTLLDGDLSCWQAGGHFLDGLHFDRIIGRTDGADRIGWLRQQHDSNLTTGFKPQPWEQLIKVLRDMGHPHEASEVAIAKQEQMRSAGVIKDRVRKTMHWLYGKIAGYGYRPIWTVYWMAWVWLFSAFFFQVGGTYGYMGPTSPLITNPELAAKIDAACGHRREKGKQVWTNCATMPAEYTTFQPLAYSADLILPLVNLQQEEDWAPIVSVPSGENMGFGIFLRLLMWFEILFGWAASLVLVAVLGRLVEKD